MALVIYDHGYRIQTPVKFSPRGVDGMTQLARARTLPPNDRRVTAPDYDNRPPSHESPTARQARQAYNQTAKLTEPTQTRRRITVAKVMTAPVYTVAPDSSVNEAWQQMREHRVHQLAVVNDDGMLLGLVSDHELLARTSPLAQVGPVSNTATIEGCYPTQLVVATPDTEARLVALVLLERHVNAIPVLSDSGQLVGIVSRSDLLHIIANDPDFENWA